jgi:pyrimidine operon attenuation protein / uracil phosphoribosyltransferase
MTAYSKKITLMDRPRIERTIKRIAYQVAEKAKNRKIFLVGLNERGYAVAKEIEKYLGSAFENETELISLEVSQIVKQVESIRAQYVFNDAIVLLVDDVIFTGKTMFTALQHLLVEPDYTVYIAVLVDRGHLSLPVKSEFIGMEIPTKPKENVELTLLNDVAEEVFLYRE